MKGYSTYRHNQPPLLEQLTRDLQLQLPKDLQQTQDSQLGFSRVDSSWLRLYQPPSFNDSRRINGVMPVFSQTPTSHLLAQPPFLEVKGCLFKLFWSHPI